MIEPPSADIIPQEYLSTLARRRFQVLFGLGAFLLLVGSLVSCLVTQPMPSVKPGSGPCPVEAAKLEAHVRFLSVDCSPRDWQSREGLEKAAGYIAESFRSMGGRMSDQVFEARGKSFRNVIASFGPEGDPRIVVGAHYDACGPYPAADDNASGVAGLLELARLLGRNPPASRVDLVAYTLEEPPFFRTRDMGSAHHARWMKEERLTLKAMISLEMIGRFLDAPDSQRYPSVLISPLYPDRGDFIAVVGRFGDIHLVRTLKAAMRRATPLPVVSINAPRWVPGLDFSDHHPYWDEGFPAAMVTDTAFFRNADYHTAQDTADKLDYARMARVVQGVHAAVQVLAAERDH